MPVLPPQTKAETLNLSFIALIRAYDHILWDQSLILTFPKRPAFPKGQGGLCVVLIQFLMHSNKLGWRWESRAGGREGGTGGNAGRWRWRDARSGRALYLLSLRSHSLLPNPEQKQCRTKPKGKFFLSPVMKSGGGNPWTGAPQCPQGCFSRSPVLGLWLISSRLPYSLGISTIMVKFQAGIQKHEGRAEKVVPS